MMSGSREKGKKAWRLECANEKSLSVSHLAAGLHSHNILLFATYDSAKGKTVEVTGGEI